MPILSDKPVIFLAFANDAKHPLPELENEFRNLTAALRGAQESGLCEVHTEPFATRDLIFDTFSNSRFKDRIAIFHFAGHAGAGQLLFSDPEKNSRAAHISGLARLLGRQPRLQLVFLNGCSTHPQVRALCDANVSSVISTSTAIVDKTARNFSSRFYQCLANGGSIASSFDTAAAEALSDNGDGEIRDLYKEGCPANDAFPWSLEYRSGAESVADWNLPEAAKNPLFGLPPVPAYDLPQCPFRHLNWFGEEHAELFYGRGHQIRDLYTRITAKNSAPIVLFHGQSGVGKSSILSAGVRPRLDKRTYEVLYQRRDQAKGLSGTLREALRASGGDVPLDGAWKALEMALERDVVVFLDQVEEVFTRPAEARPHELEEFFDQLTEVFSRPTNRPRGKLVLSFRKEWYAEIESQLTIRKLPFKSVLVDRLDRTGIIEAISAPLKHQRLIAQYNLNIDDGLPNDIAADLLQDSSSPVAPLLQILLTEMWEEAYKHNSANPHFTAALYKKLKRKSMGEFLKGKLQELEGLNSNVVKSGLALDVLAFHTTPWGTVEQRTPKALQEEYSDQAQVLPALIQQCKILYLLVDPNEPTENTFNDTRLGHDTLAPHISKEFDESDRPGQRARRILENNASEWKDGEQGTPLNERDLSIVEQGQSGMRDWTVAEAKLVAASRDERKQRKRRRKKWQFVGLLAVILITVFGGIGWWKNEEALQQASIAHIRELVAQAQANLEEFPQLSVLLAAEAARAALKHDGQIPNAERTLRKTLEGIHGYGLGPISPIPDHSYFYVSLTVPDAYHDNAISPDSRWVITRGIDENTVQVWDLKTKDFAKNHRVLQGHKQKITTVAISADSRWVVTASAYESTVMLWDLNTLDSAKRGQELHGHEQGITSVAISSDSRWVVTGGLDGRVWLWDLQVENLASRGKELGGFTSPITSVAISTEGRWVVATGTQSATAKLWDRKSADSARDSLTLSGPMPPAPSLPHFLTKVDISANSRWLVAHSDSNDLWLWDLQAADLAKSRKELPIGKMATITSLIISADSRWLFANSSHQAIAWLWDLNALDPTKSGRKLTDHENPIMSVAISSDSRWLVTGTLAGSVQLRDLTAADPMKSIQELRGYEHSIRKVGISGNNRWVIAIGEEDKTARVWDLKVANPNQSGQVLRGHEGWISSMAISADSRWVATTGVNEETFRLWDLNASDLTTNQPVLQGHKYYISRLAISSDKHWLVTAGWDDNSPRLWDLQAVEPAKTGRELGGHTREVTSIAISADSRWLVTASQYENTAWLWDLKAVDPTKSGRELGVHVDPTKSGRDPGLPEGITCVAISADNRWVVTGSWDKKAKLWDLQAADPAKTGRVVGIHTRPITHVAIGADSRLFTGGRDGVVALWDLKAADPIQTEQVVGKHERSIVDMAVSANGRWVVTVGEKEDTARLWDLKAAEPAKSGRELRGHGQPIMGVSISADSRWMITTEFNKASVWLWDLKALDPTKSDRELSGHEHPIDKVAISADSRWVVTGGGADKTAWLWDLNVPDPSRSGRIVGVHGQPITSIAIGTSGHFVITGSKDGTGHIWNLDFNDLIRQGGRLVGRNLRTGEWNRYFPGEDCRKTFPEIIDDGEACSAIKAKGIWTSFSDSLDSFIQALMRPVKQTFP